MNNFINELRIKAINEHHEQARNTFRIIFNWYAFLITINAFAGNWFIVNLVNFKSVPISFILTAASAFILSDILGIIALKFVAKSYKEHVEKISHILLQIEPNITQHEIDGLQCIPLTLYVNVALLKCISIVAMILCWTSGALLALQLDGSLALWSEKAMDLQFKVEVIYHFFHLYRLDSLI